MGWNGQQNTERMDEIKKSKPKNWRKYPQVPKRADPAEHTFDVMLKNGVVIHGCIWANTFFNGTCFGVNGFHAVTSDGAVPIDYTCIEKWRPA